MEGEYFSFREIFSLLETNDRQFYNFIRLPMVLFIDFRVSAIILTAFDLMSFFSQGDHLFRLLGHSLQTFGTIAIDLVSHDLPISGSANGKTTP